MEEIWKPIEGFTDYFISNLGRVKSIKWKMGREKIIKPYLTGRKYYRVTLSKNGIQHTKSVHNLVVDTFLNTTNNYINPVVDHIDENKLNNCVNNLRIISNRDNVAKSYRNCRKITSMFPGVYWSKNNNIWVSQIVYKKKTYHLGNFKDEEDAAKVYEKAHNDIESDTFNIENFHTKKYKERDNKAVKHEKES